MSAAQAGLEFTQAGLRFVAVLLPQLPNEKFAGMKQRAQVRGCSLSDSGDSHPRGIDPTWLSFGGLPPKVMIIIQVLDKSATGILYIFFQFYF